MPVTTWNTVVIDNDEYLAIDAKLRVPLEWDPNSEVFVAVAAPTGGILNYPALIQGDPGETPDIDTLINFTAMDHDDPAEEYASWTETSPNVYKLNLGLKRGEPGTDGTSTLDPDAYGTPVSKKILIVNPTADGFVYQSQKVGDRYIPSVIQNTPSGNPGFTLCSVGVPAQDFDWRPEVSGQCEIIGTAEDVTVDLLARLSTTGIANGETAGNIVGRAIGKGGVNPPIHVLSSGPPAGSVDTYDRVGAGNTATIYLRAERRLGTETFTTSASTTEFMVRVCPIP